MTPRYTRKDADAAFNRLCLLLGKRGLHYEPHEPYEPVPEGSVVLSSGRYRSVPGGWALDYNPTYGGYQVQELIAGSTGITLPLGDRRRSAQEFWWFVHDLEELHRRGLVHVDSDRQPSLRGRAS